MIGDGNPDSLWFRQPNGFQQTAFQIGQEPDFSVSCEFHWTAIPLRSSLLSNLADPEGKLPIGAVQTAGPTSQGSLR